MITSTTRPPHGVWWTSGLDDSGWDSGYLIGLSYKGRTDAPNERNDEAQQLRL
jgi:hypothetical protein